VEGGSVLVLTSAPPEILPLPCTYFLGYCRCKCFIRMRNRFSLSFFFVLFCQSCCFVLSPLCLAPSICTRSVYDCMYIHIKTKMILWNKKETERKEEAKQKEGNSVSLEPRPVWASLTRSI